MSVLGDNPTPVYVVDVDNPVSGGSALPVYVVNHADFTGGGGAGVTDHAELDNLDYASSGHTGFVAESDLAIEFGTGFGSIRQIGLHGAGQITLTNGSAAVVGIGTTFIGDSGYDKLAYWYQISVDGVLYNFDDVTSETTAVLSVPWAGATQTIDLVFKENNVSSDSGVGLGLDNTVSGEGGVGIGIQNNVSGAGGVALGSSNNVTASRGVALGYTNFVGGVEAVAIGNISFSNGNRAVTIGTGLNAPAAREVAVGAYNTPYTPAGDNTDRAFSVGNGTDTGGGESDAFVVLKNGQTQVQSLRINQAPTVGVVTPTHFGVISWNGVDYKVALQAV